MAKKSKYNPRGDDDVERGYQKHQKWYKNKEKKRKKQQKKAKAKKDSSYEVSHSGSTVRQKGLKP